MNSPKDFRAWCPGDGIRCTNANRSAEGFPCGPPVATRRMTVQGVGRKRGPGSRTELLCANHFASLFILGGLGAVNGQAEREAREAVLASHWDEFQTERAERRTALKAKLLEEIPDEFRPLVEQGLAAHPDDR